MIEEREITLSSAIRVIWERGKRILQLTILAMIIGGLVTLLIPNRYRSTTKLVVRVSSIGTHTIEKNELPYELYWNIFPSIKTLNHIIDQFQLDKPPYSIEHHKDLRKRIYIDNMRDQPIFSISVTLENATKAAEVTNYLATEAIEETRKLHQQEIERSYDRLEQQLQSIDKEMEKYQNEYLQTLQENKMPILQQKLDSNNATLATLRQQKETLDISIEELQTRMAGFEEMFSATDFTKFIYTRRSVIDDAVLMEELRSQMRNNQTPSNLDRIGDLNLISQELNGSYLQLDMEYRKLKIDLPGMLAKREAMIERIRELEKIIAEQQEKIFAMQVEEQIAKQNFDRSIEILSGIDKQVGWVGTTVNTERLDVYQVDEAIPDHKEVYPQRAIIVGIVGMIAFLLSFIYYLLIDLYGLVAERKPSQ